MCRRAYEPVRRTATLGRPRIAWLPLGRSIVDPSSIDRWPPTTIAWTAVAVAIDTPCAASLHRSARNGCPSVAAPVVAATRCPVNHRPGTIIDLSHARIRVPTDAATAAVQPDRQASAARSAVARLRHRRPARGMSRVRFPRGACCRTKSRPAAAGRAIAGGGAVRSGAYANGCLRLRRTTGASRLASRDADAGQGGTRCIADRCDDPDRLSRSLHRMYDLRVRPAGWRNLTDRI